MYSINEAYVGMQAIGDVTIPSTVQQCPLGQMVTGIDSYFGFGEFIYLNATAAHGVGRLVTWDGLFATTDVANAAGFGQPFAAAAANMPIGAYGWYAIGGIRPIQVNATVAIGSQLGVTAGGIAGAWTTTKGLGNAKVIQSQLYAPTVANVQTTNASKRIYLPGVTYQFVGLPITGTGIPGSTTISAVDPSQNILTLSNAATATGTATMTFTFTGFSLVQLNRPNLPSATT